jgi:two-component system, sensor histidine kinase and response regulator
MVEELRGDILVVDDLLPNRELLTRLLSNSGHHVRQATNGQSALQSVQSYPPELILLDINMPGMNGFEVCERLKADEITRRIPVIFISARDALMDRVRGFDVGGVDYITKPYQFEEVMARVQNQLVLYRQRIELEKQRNEIAELREIERHVYEDDNRMRNEYVQTLSHDLKNPISMIVGYVDLLVSQGFVTHPDGLDYLEQIRIGAEQMRSLVVDLLDLARLEQGLSLKQHPVAIGKLVLNCATMHEFQASQKNLRLTVDPPPPNVILEVDSARIEQVLNNLVVNAIRYTPEHGQIDIGYELQDTALILFVRDTGIGIPADDLEHVFDKFYRVQRNQADGTGLGLAIARAIVEQHDGCIWANSNQGTTFYVSLPMM